LPVAACPSEGTADRARAGGDDPLKILILKPSSLGDVVQSIPVLRMLKKHLPQSEIHWWISTGLSSLLECDPDLAGIVPFDRQRWTTPRFWREIVRDIRALRGRQFDWVIDLQSLARSAIVAWMARGTHTIGLADYREGAPALYDAAVPRPSHQTHAVDWYLEVLKALGVPIRWDFDWMPVRKDVCARMDDKWPVRQERWILFQPGARWLNKRWPVEHFGKLAQTLLSRDRGLRIGIIGSRQETDLAEAIAAYAPASCLNLAGQTSLPEMVEWIRASRLLVTNDTGPMHIAAALGTPIVAIFGPTSPHRTGPYRQIDKALGAGLPCAPCMKSHCFHLKHMECMHGVEPARVADEVAKRMADRSCLGA
jgi:lipopolysaccharide heptosyltransferase I